MKQTPVHDNYNSDLLEIMTTSARNVVEVGCSSGALARAYKTLNPDCHYTGIDVDPNYADIARQYCDEAICLDIENADNSTFESLSKADCWVFGDSLEHLKDPWTLLKRIREAIPDNGSIVACIPNAQHWSLQANLNSGNFFYQNAGLLDRTHLRWFTRITIGELFASTGYEIVEGIGRVFKEPEHDKILGAIRAMAIAAGTDPDQAVADAAPLQYVVRAIPLINTAPS